MMKKRVLSMVLASTMCIGLLAGCGSETAAQGGETSTSAEDGYNVAVIVKLTDGHFNKVIAGAEAYEAEHSNVTVDIQSPSAATAYDEQMNMIETTLSNPQYDAVIISPQQSDTAETLVANTDKVVIALDTDFTSDKKSTFVGTGNEDAARAGGEAAAKAAIASGIEKPTAVIMTGVQGDETHDARLNGYREGFESAGGEVVEVQYCEALADRAATNMEAVMQMYPDGIDVVLSTNDDMAMAVVRTISDSGSAAYENTIVCGFDGNQSAIEAVQSNTLALDVAQNGYDMGYKAVEAAINVLEGQSVESFIDSGSTIVDASNVDAFIADMQDKGLWE